MVPFQEIFNELTLSLALLVIGLICAHAYRSSLKTYSFFEDLGVPYEKPKLFIGNLRNYPFVGERKHQFHFVEEIYKKHADEKYVGMFKLRKPMLMVRDPAICNQILTTHFDKFRNRPGPPVDVTKDPLSNNLINMHGDQWRNTRSKLSRAFSPFQLKIMFEDIINCSIELCNDIRTDGDVELVEFFAQFDLKVSGKCFLGLESSVLNNPYSQYNVMFKDILKPTLKSKYKQILQFLFPQYSGFVERKNFSPDVYNFLDGILSEFSKSSNNGRSNMLNLMHSIDPSILHADSVTNKSVILSNICLFLSTGYETTSHTLSSLLYELTLNPDVQDKLRGEVKREFSPSSYRSLSRLHYLDHVVAESQRLHPVNTSLSRQCTAEQFKLPESDVTIPRGTHLCIPTFAMYKDGTYFPDPDAFYPDRFSDPRNQAKLLLPFGDGPRQCLAKRYTLLEMKCVVSCLILQYKFLRCSKTEVPLTITPDKLFISPTNGIWIKFEEL